MTNRPIRQAARTLVAALLLAMTTHAVVAQTLGVVTMAEAGRVGDSVGVVVRLNPEMLELAKGDALTITPRLVAGEDSVELPSIHVLGRMPYYLYVRQGYLPFEMPGDIILWEKRRYRPFVYRRDTPYRPWMDHASLRIAIHQTDLCGAIDNPTDALMQQPSPQLVPAAPIVEQRVGTITGTAYVTFPVNLTHIYPDYLDNPTELAKIQRSIERVSNDTAATLQHLSIKGYASPEGPYNNNVRLARERTDSLLAYLRSLYNIPDNLLSADYEPEDWQGLRRYVEQATTQQLPHRQQILDIIDSQQAPDAKERAIKRYAQDYQHLLKFCLPYLRHTDYRIDYERRELVERPGVSDTLWRLPQLNPIEPLLPRYKTFRALLAVKTNLLFDALAAVNVEAELPLGSNNRWSLMAEYWTPWYVWHHNSRAYEFQTVGFGLHYWLGRCRYGMPKLTGAFVGVYVNTGKYDIEWNSNGDQGEFTSLGATYGFSWPIHRHWNFEASASAGVFWGPRRHYHGEFGDTHLIWKRNASTFYVGPTKLKLSIVYMLGPGNTSKKKGGRL